MAQGSTLTCEELSNFTTTQQAASSSHEEGDVLSNVSSSSWNCFNIEPLPSSSFLFLPLPSSPYNVRDKPQTPPVYLPWSAVTFITTGRPLGVNERSKMAVPLPRILWLHLLENVEKFQSGSGDTSSSTGVQQFHQLLTSGDGI
ncbi:unnamed protein product [Pleuronectes platessa]|uniref:Uncharacterized protein n=1 Tax=Pleuronectes platessa TaxID=8262 RepID=A0A9N7UFR6_PLEPL|nr:unnamed protein product [Pleuronectes platessa]